MRLKCDRAVKEIHAAGYLDQLEWGFDGGVHAAWAIVEVESLEHPRQIVPWMFRDNARIVMLVRYETANKVHHRQRR